MVKLIRNKPWYTKLITSLLLAVALSIFGGQKVQARVVDEPVI